MQARNTKEQISKKVRFQCMHVDIICVVFRAQYQGCEKPASNSMNFLQVNEDKKAWNTEKAVKNSPRVSIIYMIKLYDFIT